jgi:hypothetical protein
MPRTGKIARLPRAIREELNSRLADGETGARLVDWLNGLPEVKAALVAHFGGRPINEPNLTDWKQGGFEDWLRHEQARDWVAQLIEESDELDEASGPNTLADRAAIPVTVALGRLLQQALASDDPAQQTKTVVAVSQQLAQLRRADRDAERLRFEEQRAALELHEARWLAKVRAINYREIIQDPLPKN